MASATKEQTAAPGRIYSIPQYFGGEVARGDTDWHSAIEALFAMGRNDPVIALIARQIDHAYGECMDAAVTYGRALGPDSKENIDDLSDAEYEVRMGKARKP